MSDRSEREALVPRRTCKHGWKRCKECNFNMDDETALNHAPEHIQRALRPDSRRDPVNHPPHYTSHPSGVECIQITRHFNFNRGNAIKYIWRAGEKGDEVEDLKKAAWYIADEIKRLEGAKS